MQDILISTEAFCTTRLNPAKRAMLEAILRLANSMPARAGKNSPLQVVERCRTARIDFDYISWAFLVYCAPAMFREMHADTLAYNAVAMRGVIAAEFYGGDMNFEPEALPGYEAIIGVPENS
jgi:hypothetical protein